MSTEELAGRERGIKGWGHQFDFPTSKALRKAVLFLIWHVHDEGGQRSAPAYLWALHEEASYLAHS